MASPVVFAFPDRRSWDDWTPVIGEDGELLATLSPGERRYRFAAKDADGEELCRGRLRSFSGWEAVDAEGAHLVGVGPGLFGRYTVRLRDNGIRALLRGRAYRGDLTLTNGEQFLLNSTPSDGLFAFGDTDWIIRTDGTLNLAEVVAVVELHRLEMRRRRKPTPRQRRRQLRRRR